MTDLEIFVITNGRGTFDYVMAALEAQTEKRRITVIRDMKWVDALNQCVKLCESNYFLRVDDDMVLHPYAVAYFLTKMQKIRKRKGGVYVCRLWEDWSKKPVNGIRMYSRKVAKRLGFKASKLGKVDKVFQAKLIKSGRRQLKDGGIVGIHILGSIEDQKKYRKLWRNKNAKITKEQFSRTFDNLIHPVHKSIPKQVALLSKLRKINKKYRCKGFLRFIYKQRESERQSTEK